MYMYVPLHQSLVSVMMDETMAYFEERQVVHSDVNQCLLCLYVYYI